MNRSFLIGLFCAIASVPVLGAEQPNPISELPSTPQDALVVKLVDEWEAVEPKTNAGVQKLLQDLLQLGTEAESAIVKGLQYALTKKAHSIGTVAAAVVRLKSQSAVPVLIAALKTEQNIVAYYSMLVTLGELANPNGIPAILSLIEAPAEELIDRLKCNSEQADQVVERAIKALLRLTRSPDNAHLLVRLMGERTPGLTAKKKMLYASILQNVPGYSSEEMLLVLARDQDIGVQIAAVSALGHVGTDRGALFLISLLEQRNSRASGSAATALGRLKCEAAIPKLITALSDKAQKASAAWALGQITGLTLGSDEKAWQTWLELERKNGQARLECLLAELKSGPPELAPIVIESLPGFVLIRPKLLEILRPHFASANPRVRAAICNALAQSADDHALRALAGFLTDSAPEVRWGALRGLCYATGEQFTNDPQVWRAFLEKRLR